MQGLLPCPLCKSSKDVVVRYDPFTSVACHNCYEADLDDYGEMRCSGGYLAYGESDEVVRADWNRYAAEYAAEEAEGDE